MISNTSETRESIMNTYTIPQLERTLEALCEVNSTETSGGSNKKVLEGTEALHYLIGSGGKL